MNSNDIRQKFLDFFESKGHRIVKSAPIVVKNDPTLMFTNAGMNQFKDYFLGNKLPSDRRVVNSQKCLRVSGKHNDLEEVGVDTYHHTMFEMLGNWSFGDYFKQEAIDWAWQLLTEVYGLDKNRLYVTVFEGSKEDKLDYDSESFDIWKKHLDSSRILPGNKKDNFWEMGDTGPCGPCSEIHYDLRLDMERFEIEGKTLVNNDHPQVIEIWNNVFMQYNRKSDGSLENLPEKHVDTGMGFERLVRAIHHKNSNYDTDIFLDTISELEKISGKNYGEIEKNDIAFRVISDHIRAISFTIADGQLPSNTGAGYVIRRILRRAIRYGYSVLDFKNPELFKLVTPLATKFKEVFPELYHQKEFVGNVIYEEEKSFLSTLSKGLEILENLFTVNSSKLISGSQSFELYDTFGFPLDLTKLIALEHGFEVDESGFASELQKQKARSRKDAVKTMGDWTILKEKDVQEFIGYDFLESTIEICRYRIVNMKGENTLQAVFSESPFYAESGGQVGDTGLLIGLTDGETIRVTHTAKENNLSIHTLDKLPANPRQNFSAQVDARRRGQISKNHTATHILHAALKSVLGPHISQKGSLVEPERLRFDFSHFAKIGDDDLSKISAVIKQKIHEQIALDERRNIPIETAKNMGATALFGEKYGDTVRVIIFGSDFSMELCGGTHVTNTREIGTFIITAEAAVAAGVRRIEAITGHQAELYMNQKLEVFESIKSVLSNPKDPLLSIVQLLEENQNLRKKLEQLAIANTATLKNQLKQSFQTVNGIQVLIQKIAISDADQLKDLCFQIKNETENLFLLLGCILDDKPFIALAISDNLVKEKNWNAGAMVRLWAKEINGGGGGQAFFATAGGKDKEGLDRALNLAIEFIKTG